jgi:hypothetical protein
MKTLTTSLVFILVAVAPLVVQAGNAERLHGRYFVVIWGYESLGNAPGGSHTFATFYSGDDLAHGQVRPATISWLSTTGRVRLFGIERGHNFSLAQTLAIACKTGKRVASWGPYEINVTLYRGALARIKLLNSGRVAYNGSGLHPRGMNCIKAAGDITDTPFRPGVSWGFAASKAVVRHLSPFFKNGARINVAVARMTISNKCS